MVLDTIRKLSKGRQPFLFQGLINGNWNSSILCGQIPPFCPSALFK